MQFFCSVESVSSVTVCNSDPLNKFSDVFIFIEVYWLQELPWQQWQFNKRSIP